MQLDYEHQGQAIRIDVEADGDGWRVRLPDGAEHRITARRLPGDVLEITEGQRTFRVPFARTERGVEVSYAGRTVAFQPASGRPSRRAGTASGALMAPMTGLVAAVLAAEGQTVEAFQPLAVVEAMKVYATIEAPFAGTVQRVYVQKGERVAHGAPVIDLAPPAEAGS